MKNSGGKILNSMFWSFAQSMGSQLVSLIISTVLARLILPEAYGIIAAAHIFTSLATTFVSGGYGNALIQKKDADEKDYSTMFIFNVVFSLLVYGIIFVLAPVLVKAFNVSFDRRLLVKVIRILGIGVVLSSFNSFYRSILRKHLKFKKIFCITLAGNIISACVGIFMAYQGFGVWALVVQNLLSYFINSILFVSFSKWRPIMYFSFSRFKPMFKYGTKMMLSALMITVYADITGLVIGNRYDSENLAYYNKGVNYPKLLALNIVTSINTALFPVMSKIDDMDELKAITRKFNRISAFVMTPMMFGFAAIAPVFVELLLTKKWLPAVIFFQICCFNYAIQPLGMSSLQYLKSSGRANEYLILDVVRKVVGIVALLVAVLINKGIAIIAFSEVVSNFIAIFINMYPGKKHLDYKIREQIFDVIPKFLISTIMFCAVYCLGMLSMPLIIKLIFQIVSGVVVYVLLAKVFRMKELHEMASLVKKILRRNRNAVEEK